MKPRRATAPRPMTLRLVTAMFLAALVGCDSAPPPASPVGGVAFRHVTDTSPIVAPRDTTDGAAPDAATPEGRSHSTDGRPRRSWW